MGEGGRREKRSNKLLDCLRRVWVRSESGPALTGCSRPDSHLKEKSPEAVAGERSPFSSKYANLFLFVISSSIIVLPANPFNYSIEGEEVPFTRVIDPIASKGQVEDWLLQVEDVMLKSVKNVIE